MADYNGIEELLNTTEGMEHLVNNVSHDDDTMSFQGVDWFMYNNVVASALYVSGNSWTGLGSNAEQLLVCRRDCKMWHFYRQEGTLYNYYRFLKIRWEGYAQYNSTSSDVRLVYEWFFFNNGDMFLNLIQPPPNSGYLGTNRITYGGVNLNYNVTVGVLNQITFKSNNDIGTDFSLEYGQIVIEPPFDRKYLLSDKDGRFYTVTHERALVDAVVFKGYQYIDTGIIPDGNTKIQIAFNTKKFNDAALIGARLNTASDKFDIFLTNSTTIHAQYGTESTPFTVEEYSGKDMVVILDKNVLTVNGVEVGMLTEQEFAAPVTMLIGSVNTNGTPDSRYFYGNIGSVMVWKDEELLLDLLPCVDESCRVCFYDNVSEIYFYNMGHGTFGYIDDGGAFDEATHLMEVEVEELNAEGFQTHGVDTMPQSTVIARLVNPVVHYWQDSENELPKLKASVKALPPVQVVFSKNTLMNDSTIIGIEKVDIDSDDHTLFAFSFDGGNVWMAYVNETWVVLSESMSGMSRETVESIGTDAWNSVATGGEYMVRFVLFEGGYVNKITIHYLN